jgi:hypothetical protein
MTNQKKKYSKLQQCKNYVANHQGLSVFLAVFVVLSLWSLWNWVVFPQFVERPRLLHARDQMVTMANEVDAKYPADEKKIIQYCSRASVEFGKGESSCVVGARHAYHISSIEDALTITRKATGLLANTSKLNYREGTQGIRFTEATNLGSWVVDELTLSCDFSGEYYPAGINSDYHMFDSSDALLVLDYTCSTGVKMPYFPETNL